LILINKIEILNIMKKIIIWLLISILSLMIIITSLYYINQKDPEKIRVGKRIRDIVYNKKYNFFLLALEDGDGNIGVLSVDML